MEIPVTILYNEDPYTASASTQFPQAWSEHGLSVGTDGRPRRPNGEFASRAEVGAYFLSLVIEHTPIVSALNEPGQSEPKQQGLLQSAVPQEITNGDFYDSIIAARRRAGASLDIFAQTGKEPAPSTRPRTTLPRIALSGWSTAQRKPRQARTRQQFGA